MTDPSPVFVGVIGPLKAADVADRYIALKVGTGAEDEECDLVAGETVASCAFAVTDALGVAVAGVVTAHTETADRSDFRLLVPVAGMYTLTAVFTISDGQKVTKTATLWAV